MDNIQIAILIGVLLLIVVLGVYFMRRKKSGPKTGFSDSGSGQEQFVYLMQRKLDNGFMDLYPMSIFSANLTVDGTTYTGPNGLSFSNPAVQLPTYWVRVGANKFPGLVSTDHTAIGWNTGSYMFRLQKFSDWSIDAIPTGCNLSC